MADRTTVLKQVEAEGEIVSYLMGAVKIPKGTLVSLRVADGYAYRSRAGTATDLFVGVAYETVDNSGGSAGDTHIRVQKTGIFEFAKASAVQADVGVAMYASDNETLTATATSNQLVGYPTALISASKLALRIDRAAG